MKKTFMLFLVIIFFCTGCTVRVADLTMAGTKNLNLETMKINYERVTKNVEGSDSKVILLFFPLGYPNLEEAIDEALHKANGNLMTDAVVYWTSYSFILFGINTITVKGDVYNTIEKLQK